MPLVSPPIVGISDSELIAANSQEILRVPFFSRLCEVERPGDDSFSVYDHDLVVSYGMGCIDSGRNTGVGQEIG